MNITENTSLKNLNTFGVEANCRYFTEISDLQNLNEVVGGEVFRKNKRFVLGGGSNILFTGDFDGIILKNGFMGRDILKKDGNDILLKAGAGENWHNLVLFCVNRGYGGIENLSLIPGNVGASPMQNIGAYGVEIKDVVEEVEYFDFKTGEFQSIGPEECAFEYRSSIFKTDLKGRVIITSVTYRLSRNPVFNTSYGAIENELSAMGVEPSLKSISQAVINIRSSKLPDPKKIGNAGSFFKNPMVDAEKAEKLKAEFPEILQYPSGDGVKLAAGWLIEQCGWKGKRIGNCGVHDRQALVLVNHGGAVGEEINALAEDIRNSVLDKFNVALEREVNIV